MRRDTRREGGRGRPQRFNDNNNSGFGGGFNDRPRRFNQGPREMHKTTCADCGAECEVPFKPTEGRPVYCKECFSKHKPKRF